MILKVCNFNKGNIYELKVKKCKQARDQKYESKLKMEWSSMVTMEQKLILKYFYPYSDYIHCLHNVSCYST